MNKEKLENLRDYISDSLNAYVVYDADYETFGQVMSYYSSDLLFIVNEMLEDLSNETNKVEGTEKVNE